MRLRHVSCSRCGTNPRKLGAADTARRILIHATANLTPTAKIADLFEGVTANSRQTDLTATLGKSWRLRTNPVHFLKGDSFLMSPSLAPSKSKVFVVPVVPSW